MPDSDENTTATTVVDDASSAGITAETIQTTSESAETTATASSATAGGTVVYVGPNFVRDGLHMTTYAVYKGGLPELLAAQAAADSNFAAMFVPISGLTKARTDVNRTGCRLNKAYLAVLNSVRG